MKKTALAKYVKDWKKKSKKDSVKIQIIGAGMRMVHPSIRDIMNRKFSKKTSLPNIKCPLCHAEINENCTRKDMLGNVIERKYPHQQRIFAELLKR